MTYYEILFILEIQIGNKLVLDGNSQELSSATSSLALGVDCDGNLCGGLKLLGGSFSMAEIELAMHVSSKFMKL